MSETTTVPPSELLTPPELAERVKNGPVTIMVPDFGDPCGMRKIPRQVRAAVAADGPNGLGGQTVNRWQVFFDGPYVIPLILATSGDQQYEVTRALPAVSTEDEWAGDPPATVSGPCDRCRAVAAEKAAADQAEAQALAAQTQTAHEQQADARRVGREDGYAHASNVDLAGYSPVDWETVPVPAHFADVAEFYRSGWDDGRQAYEDGDNA